MIRSFVFTLSVCLLLLVACQEKKSSVTVPFKLDHNRMIVEGEMQRKDSSWRKVRIWVDNGSARFFISSSLAKDLGISTDKSNNGSETENNSDNASNIGLRIGEMRLNTANIFPTITTEPYWIYNALHIDANLPATILKKYQVVFDYPKQQFTIGAPGSIVHQGVKSMAAIHPETGVIEMFAIIGTDSLTFAIDIGASYSYTSDSIINHFINQAPLLPSVLGTSGYANMWGWWPPNENDFIVTRFPLIKLGSVQLDNVGMVGVPPNPSASGKSLGEWYSQKTIWPVVGFLGANALKSFRVEFDYPNSTIYFEKGSLNHFNDMDIVGLAISPERDSSYTIIGIVKKDNISVVEGINTGDKLIQVDSLQVKGNSMGVVMDALRGNPGEPRKLVIERKGKIIKVESKIQRLL